MSIRTWAVCAVAAIAVQRLSERWAFRQLARSTLSGLTFAELVCRGMTPAKWHGGASIFRGFAQLACREMPRSQWLCVPEYFGVKLANCGPQSGSSILFAQPKKLKPAVINRRLDRMARKLVWRIPIGSHRPYGTPRLELARQLETGQIAAKRAQIRICFGFEDKYPHCLASFALRPSPSYGGSLANASPPAKLTPLWWTSHRRGALILVTEDQSPLFQIIRRYFDRDAIAGEGLDPILSHPARCISDKLMTVLELNAVAAIRQYFSYETFELQQFFLGQIISLLQLCSL